MRQYRETGKAPVVRRPGFIQFPYGEHQPILYCKPLRVCDIHLEPGETVLNVALGDSERWISSRMESGPAEARVLHCNILNRMSTLGSPESFAIGT